MSRRKRGRSHANHERWLVSYADFITLLFAFFVVLYASSQVDKKKVGRLAMAIQVAFQEMGVFESSSTKVPVDLEDPMPFNTVQSIENIERTASLAQIVSHPKDALGTGREDGDVAELQHELEKTLGLEIANHEISLRREPDGLVISLREAGFFESGSGQMKQSAQSAFDRIASFLQERKCRLRIEGHTDNVPIHNVQFASNWELSTTRATEVVRLLIVKNGFNPDHLSAAGYAQYRPIATNSTPEGRAMNRRVDIVILSEELPSAPAIAEPAKEPSTKPSAGVPLTKPLQ